MRLQQLYEITVLDRDGSDRTLLVLARSESDARRLARARGRIKAIDANHGPFAAQGGSRIIGDVELRVVG